MRKGEETLKKEMKQRHEILECITSERAIRGRERCEIDG